MFNIIYKEESQACNVTYETHIYQAMNTGSYYLFKQLCHIIFPFFSLFFSQGYLLVSVWEQQFGLLAHVESSSYRPGAAFAAAFYWLWQQQVYR